MLQRIVLATARALRNERLGLEQLQRLVDKKVRASVTFAYRAVPYYHDLFKANKIHPDEIRTARDLRKIPLTTKDDVRKQGRRMVAVGVDRDEIIWKSTSGTTGEPVRVASDRRAAEAIVMQARYKIAMLAPPWDRMAHVVHSKSDPAQRREDPWGLLGRFRRRFRKLVFLDSIRHVPRVIRELASYRPRLLVSHAYNLRLIALYVNEESPSVEPQAIHTSGEVADADTTEFLEEAFGCPVYGIYAARDVARLGFQCGQNSGYHINVDHVYGEYLSNGEPVDEGELGETVWTTLDRWAMPLIRYKLGDLAVPTEERCQCGRSLPLIRSIEGRAEDLVVLADGRLVTPARILSGLHMVQGMARFRLVQRTLDRLDIEFIGSPRYSGSTEEEVLSACRNLFGTDVEVRVRERDMEVFPVKWNAVTTEVGRRATPFWD